MRPLRLELEGFTAFREKTCLDFTDLDLFAITGPTGAGKSSLIDAIAYALYGRVPRVGTSIGSCISQGLTRMWVQLEFEAGGERYCVFRETKKTGQLAIRLDHWAGAQPAVPADMTDPITNQWSPMEGGARQVNAQIEKIVGLDFDGFTRSVLLPQGQFQEFLAGDPAKRREVLAGLLQLDVYEGIRKRAHDRATQLKGDIAAREHLLETVYAQATPEAVKQLSGQLKALKGAEALLATHVAELSAARDIARTITQAREQLDDVRAKLAATTAERTKTEALMAQGATQLQAFEQSLGSIDESIQANAFDPDLMAALGIAVHIYAQRKETTSAVEVAQRELLEHQKTEKGLVGQDAGLSQQKIAIDIDLQVADEALTMARASNAALAVQRAAHIGEACPVCGGTIADLPHLDCADVDAAEVSLQDLRKAQHAAEAALTQVHTQREIVGARREAAAARIKELETKIGKLDADLAARLPPGAAPPAPNTQHPTPQPGAWSLESANQELARLQKAQQTLGRLQKERQQAEANFRELSATLAGAQTALAVWCQQEEALRETSAQTETSFQERLTELRELANEKDWAQQLAGRDAGAPLEKAIQAALVEGETQRREAQQQLGQISQQVEDLKAKIAEKHSFHAQLVELKARFDVADDLAKVMQANKFQAFVQGEALQLLAEGGSRTLQALSTGRYRLQVDPLRQQDFEVIDTWNGDEARSVKTLSGGETFLASLALALTMAESLPALAATQRVVLDSIIIDEGFGSLDPEALDRAADALDALRSQNRMVCVITHLKELADRLPARVVVHKTETGSTLSVA